MFNIHFLSLILSLLSLCLVFYLDACLGVLDAGTVCLVDFVLLNYGK
jgi:hypothetical protein